MNPYQEVTIHLEKLQQKLSNINNQYDGVCREMNELNVQGVHLAEYSKKLDSKIDVCEQLLAESDKCLATGSNRQLRIDLKIFNREKLGIDAMYREVKSNIENLDCNAVDLLDQSHKLETVIELCQRTLAGEDVSIWAELQRFGF